MTRDPDPLEELRESWNSLEPPAPVRDLAAEDAETRAAVRWMASTWNALEAPEPRAVPTPIRSTVVRRAAPVLSLAPRLALAAAAGLFVWFGFVASRPDPSDTALSNSGLSQSGAANGAPELAAVTAPSAPVLLAATEERVEMRSGGVRLVLLQPPAPTAGGTPR